MTSIWKYNAERAQSRVTAKIPAEWRLPTFATSEVPRNVHHLFEACGILNERELAITNSADATAILDRLRRREWSSKEVVTAYCKRAAVAHQLVNCLMDIDFEGAIKRAGELDDHLERTGEAVGPLHGLPVSIKDLTSVKDMHYSFGFAAWIDRVSTEDAWVVQSLRKAGAVIYLKTTMPQTGMALETVSPLWGRTLNPRNTLLSAGGSSGGEGALIACRGAPIGMLTDIGGSIRAPSAFNGLYGIKPTSRRTSYLGGIAAVPGQLSVASAIGPGGRSLRDLQLILQIWSDDEPWTKDPNVVPMPWQPKEVPDRITIGVLWHDGVVIPHPPIRRVLKDTVDKLRAAGHEVIDMAPYKHEHAWEIAHQLYFPSAAKQHRAILAESGEPVLPPVAKLLEGLRDLSATEWMAYNAKMTAYQIEYLQHWNQTAARTSNGMSIDAILTPALACASFPHDFYPWWGYFATWNLLNYPAIILPVGHVDKQKDAADQSFVPLNDIDKANYEIYDPEVFDGAHVSLQLVGQYLQEEKLMSIAERIDRDVIRGHSQSQGQQDH